MKTRTKGAIAAGGLSALTLAVGIIKPWEGFRAASYQDVVGVWTICYGETKGVRPGMTKTPAECETMLFKRVAEFQRGLNKCLRVNLPARTEAALISWTYNVGIGAACGSTLVRLGNAGRLEAMCRELPKWNRAGGRVVKGLVNRRAAEMADCLAGLREGVALPLPPQIETPPPQLTPAPPPVAQKPVPAPEPPETVKPRPEAPQAAFWPFFALGLAALLAVGVVMWRKRR